MSISSQVDDTGNDVTIRVSGRFDFRSHMDFCKAYEQVPASAARYVVDLSDAEHMDSSALGMLLMLREHAGGAAADVSIENPPEPIRKILEIANFHRLFKLA